MTLADYGTFKPVELEPGGKPIEVSFRLWPDEDKSKRVEASVGAWLELEFRPSRESEKWARPKFRTQLTVR